jgi:hypothetical protein
MHSLKVRGTEIETLLKISKETLGSKSKSNKGLRQQLGWAEGQESAATAIMCGVGITLNCSLKIKLCQTMFHMSSKWGLRLILLFSQDFRSKG